MFIKVEKDNITCKDPIEETKTLLKNNNNIVICTKLENSAQVAEMEKLINDLGLEYEVKEQDDYYQLTTIKGTVERDVRTNNHYLLYIDKDYLGENKDLGTLLLYDYLFELLNSPFIPNLMILVNEGVLLLNQKSEVYRVIQSLEKIGINIFVCAKSLNYFHIPHDDILGNIINMDGIIKVQLKAEKIIKI